MSENEARKIIHRSDEDRMSWTRSILERDDPWNISMYDMVLPTDKMTSEEIANLVEKTLERDVLKASADSSKAVQDFILASRVEIALAREGHIIAAEADAGAVMLTINKNVILLKKLEDELQSIASRVPGRTVRCNKGRQEISSVGYCEKVRL